MGAIDVSLVVSFFNFVFLGDFAMTCKRLLIGKRPSPAIVSLTPSCCFFVVLAAALAAVGLAAGNTARADSTIAGDVDPDDPAYWSGYTPACIGNASAGSVTVDNYSTIYSAGLYVGNTANGTLNISSGGTVTAWDNCYVGYGAGTTGRVTISGGGSALTVGGIMSVGYNGTGLLHLDNGAQLTFAAGSATIGRKSTGTLRLSNGSHATFLGTDEHAVGDLAGSVGVITVESGSTLTGRTLYAGYNGVATINLNGGLFETVACSAAVKAGSSFVLNINGGTLSLPSTDPTYSSSSWISVSSGNGLIYIKAGGATFNTLDGAMVLGGIPIVTGVSGAPDGGITKTGGGQRTLGQSQACTYTGPTNVNAGTLRVGKVNGLPTATSVTLSGSSILDVYGYSQTIGSLAGGASSQVQLSYTSTSRKGVLTVGDSTSSTFAGVISNGTTTSYQAWALVKRGSGTLTLSGANTYTGLTTVLAGALKLVDQSSTWANAFNPVLSLGGAKIGGGQLVFNYASTYDDATALSNVQTAITSDKIAESLHTPPVICHGDATNDLITVVNTLLGDADVNGTVNGADLNIVLSNYNATCAAGHAGWLSGDFDFNSTINGADLNIVLSNYNQVLSATTAVPEPSALLLAAAGLAGLAAFAWRRR
jgi:autotransporter-associated beta strand protein/T5SS/PEP-CTERM-associated repeat protein